MAEEVETPAEEEVTEETPVEEVSEDAETEPEVQA